MTVEHHDAPITVAGLGPVGSCLAIEAALANDPLATAAPSHARGVGGAASVVGPGWAFGAVAVASVGLAVWAATTPAFPPREPQPLSALISGNRGPPSTGLFTADEEAERVAGGVEDDPQP